MQRLPRSLWGIVGFCMALLFFAVFFRASFQHWLQVAAQASLRYFGGFYLYLGFALLVLLLLLALLPVGKWRLGEQAPAFSNYSWGAMLFSTGMGPGLMLRAVQEPAFFYQNPPIEGLYEAAPYALAYTFFHWGFTPWAFYGFFALLVAYMMYQRQHKMLLSDFLGLAARKAAWADSIVILCTLVGVVAALGLGSRQVVGGLAYLLGKELPEELFSILVMALLVLLATFSALSGLGRSIKYISNFNLGLSFFFLLFVAFQSEVFHLWQLFAEAMGIYLKDFVAMSLNTGSARVSEAFLSDWTYFYWAFWLAWVPFTGLFIARISAGRSIRHFILGVLLFPSLGTFCWFSAFGTLLFSPAYTDALAAGHYESIYTSIFYFFDSLPAASFTKPLALLLVITFLLTSIDSAIFVLSVFSDGGHGEPRRALRALWGLLIALLTGALLYVGAGQLLQSMSYMLVLFALPFSLLYTGVVLYFLFLLWKDYRSS